MIQFLGPNDIFQFIDIVTLFFIKYADQAKQSFVINTPTAATRTKSENTENILI